MRYSSDDYRLIDKTAIELRIDYGFLDEKLDVFALAKKLNMHLITYSYLSDEQKTIIASMEDFLKDGFTVMRCNNGKWEFYTFYDDSVSKYRQRFTIAHEIKHVVFLEKEPDQKQEDLADHFARYLLAPSFLVMKYVHLSPFDVSDAFDISFEASINALNGANNRIDYGYSKLEDYEEEYLELMKQQ